MGGLDAQQTGEEPAEGMLDEQGDGVDPETVNNEAEDDLGGEDQVEMRRTLFCRLCHLLMQRMMTTMQRDQLPGTGHTSICCFQAGFLETLLVRSGGQIECLEISGCSCKWQVPKASTASLSARCLDCVHKHY